MSQPQKVRIISFSLFLMREVKIYKTGINYLMAYNEPNNSIWEDSPCSLPFVAKAPSLEKAQRFHYNSIYYRDDPFKPARKVDEFQKPDLLLQEFRRQIRQATRKPKSIIPACSDISKISSKKTFYKLDLKSEEIVERLYPTIRPRLQLKFDSFGNRSSFFDDKDEVYDHNTTKQCRNSSNRKRNESIHFTDTLRHDLSKPVNFNPGPGSYFQKPKNKEGSKQKKHKTIQIR